MQDSQIVCTDGDGLKRVAGLLQSPFVGAAPGIGLNEQQAWRGAFEPGQEALRSLGLLISQSN